MKQHNRTWPIIFAHGDLNNLNILVWGDEIIGIVDWETAGWHPSYLEYKTACQVNPSNSFWIDEIGKFLTLLSDELAMDQTGLKHFGLF